MLEDGSNSNVSLDIKNTRKCAYVATLKVDMNTWTKGGAGIDNEGFGGIAVCKVEKKIFKYFAKKESFKGKTEGNV